MSTTFDLVIVGANPGGIMAAIAAARLGRSALLLDRNAHIGGLPANGLGATDIADRRATWGLFGEFVTRIRAHYVQAYGAQSQQVADCSDGYHFEPHVGEQVLEAMIADPRNTATGGRITVLRRRQFDAVPANLDVTDGPGGRRVRAVRVTNLDSGAVETYAGRVFVDGTYEGDLSAAAGAAFRTDREGHAEFKEPLAGRVYKAWAEPAGEGSTGEGDDTLQAYNYRLCLTSDPALRVPIARPANYNRAEYAELADDIRLDRSAGKHTREREWDGIGRLVNIVILPNHKTDSNNQHLAFISTDLPEENYPWPTADWAWRDRFAVRLREYTLGLLYFAQNDDSLPEAFRAACARWGLARDEYTDNGHFPRQVYVREGRRIQGEHLFTAHDSIPTSDGGRPPIYADSITASCYAIDSHAVRKREPGRVHLDGFLSYRVPPYTVPYGVIVPRGLENVLAPVPVSATHLGFGTLRMEPCWMALGQAAGVAAHLAIAADVPCRAVDRKSLQHALLAEHAVLMCFHDLPWTHPHAAAVQYWGLRGLVTEWACRPDEPVTADEAREWMAKAGHSVPCTPGVTRRSELLAALYTAAQR